jgi:histidyl-tRNA synthetase
MEPLRIPRGTVDLTGEALDRVRSVEAAARRVFGRFGYGELRGPLFEETRLFARTTGETSDIVEKEMFTIPREKEPYSLRPEGTPSVVRHYVEQSLFANQPFQKFFYAGPMFRHERPQAGRQRQFHQVGVEALGSADPLLDAELILVQDRFFRELDVTGQEVLVNTIGCRECRPVYRERLLEALRPRAAELCGDCRRRMEKNPLRMLDCKEEACGEIAAGLPLIEDMVCAACTEHYAAVLSALTAAGVAFKKDPGLVRGLDYYTRTVFETVHPALGARSAICGGGRYDGLVEELGGPATPALGFAVGVEATLLALSKLGRTPAIEPSGLDAFLVAVKPDQRPAVFAILTELRDAGLKADMDYEGRGMKAQMKKAARAAARHAIILGPGEVERGTVTIRLLEDGSQEEVAQAELVVRLSAGGVRE